MKLAYACKSILELPSTDKLRLFDFQEKYRFFDFTQRHGNASSHPICNRELIEGNTNTFWILSDELSTSQLRYSWTNEPEVMHDLWMCMQRFLGICVEGLCSGQRSAPSICGRGTSLLRSASVFMMIINNHSWTTITPSLTLQTPPRWYSLVRITTMVQRGKHSKHSIPLVWLGLISSFSPRVLEETWWRCCVPEQWSRACRPSWRCYVWALQHDGLACVARIISRKHSKCTVSNWKI